MKIALKVSFMIICICYLAACQSTSKLQSDSAENEHRQVIVDIFLQAINTSPLKLNKKFLL